MGVADSFGVSQFFEKENWDTAGRGLNLLVTDPGRAGQILGEEFKNHIADPAMRGLNYAIQNPSGAANILQEEATAAAQSFQAGVSDLARRTAAGAQFLYRDPVGAGQVLVNSPRELGQVAGTAAGVALDFASAGSTRAARVGVSVAGEVAETALTQTARQLAPNPGAVVDAAIPNAPSPRIRPDAPAPAAPARPSSAPVEVTVRPGDRVSYPAGSQLGDVRLRDVAGGDVVTHRAELPLAGRPANEIASQVAAQTPGYSRFTHPSTPAGSVRDPAVSVGANSQMGDLTIDRVAGGSIGDFEFNFTRGSGANPPAAPAVASRPPAAPSTSSVAPQGQTVPTTSSVVNFSDATQVGDVTVGDIAGRNMVNIGVDAPSSVLTSPEVQAAGMELVETLSRHTTSMPPPPLPNGGLVDIGAGTQMGDVTLGNLAGGHMLEVNVRLPHDVTPTEAANILRGLRDGLEQAWQLGEASTRSRNSARFSHIPG